MKNGDRGMFFYVEESEHTGSELFDTNQPVLYYGVLSSDLNLDVLAEERLGPLRKRLAWIGCTRLSSCQTAGRYLRPCRGT